MSSMFKAMIKDLRSTLLPVLVWLALSGQAALATWSIVLIDTETHEIAVGSATCLTNFDLQAELPVVITGVGAATAQALVDFGAVNRTRIDDGFRSGLRPIDILNILEQNDPDHQDRQYGILSRDGRSLTFTGANTFAYAGGVTGQAGTLVYAIQGNILTGVQVVDAAEQAVLNTPGGLPDKLMAGMEAARSMGGDGRCSCTLPSATGCGSPPALFTKAAHIGFMIVARLGDGDGVCNAALGCANGDYFLDFNIAGQGASDPDPVFQMRDLFDAWRAALIGKPDAVQSTAVLEPSSFRADGGGTAVMSITLRDPAGTIVTDPALTVTVQHDANDSAVTTQIGPVISDGGGAYHVAVIGSDRVGVDRFRVTVEGAGRPVVVLPRPTLTSFSPADFDQDRDVDRDDHAVLTKCLAGPGSPMTMPCDIADVNADGRVDLRDVQRLQTDFTDRRCIELFIDQQPQPVRVRCRQPFTLSTAVSADPPATFQWFLDGVPIPGATGSDYQVASTLNADLGLYFVEVKNTCGTLVSDSVLVETFRPPCP